MWIAQYSTGKGITMTTVDIGAVLSRLLAVALLLSVLQDLDGLFQAANLLALGLFDTAFLWSESLARVCLAVILWFLPHISVGMVLPASVKTKPIGELNVSAIEKAGLAF